MIAQSLNRNNFHDQGARVGTEGTITPRYEPPSKPMSREGTQFLEPFALATALYF